MSERDHSNYSNLEASIMFQQEILLKRNKANQNLPVVNRGRVSLKVIRDASGSSFRFVGTFYLSV